ncbi:MAG: hypothetical protein AAF532_15570 [Planctomycetota bacterium]
MNTLTPTQRKWVYLAAIVVLLFPVIYLGRPASLDDAGATVGGGKLADLRKDYDLGETSLGDVDPSSSTMNLVLLGFRGIAASQLWVDAIDGAQTKDWGKLKDAVQSIIMLQPHYVKVWRFQGWNLAYNVSSAWDNVDDRYYWVKDGAKFLKQGQSRNERVPDLAHDTGNVIGQKIGRADEWRFYRNFFKADPDTDTYGGGPDTELNPDGLDNYLAAREEHLHANELELNMVQHVMARSIFRSLPARALIEYANAINREGVFGDVSAEAWADAFEAWTGEYGSEPMLTEVGEVYLEAFDDDISAIAKDAGTSEEAVRYRINRLQNMTNYRFWRERCRAEADTLVSEGRSEIYDGKQAFRNGDTETAKDRIISGLEKFEVARQKYELFAQQDLVQEDIMVAIRYLQVIYVDLEGGELPEDTPLFDFWQQNQYLLDVIEAQFRAESRY